MESKKNGLRGGLISTNPDILLVEWQELFKENSLHICTRSPARARETFQRPKRLADVNSFGVQLRVPERQNLPVPQELILHV